MRGPCGLFSGRQMPSLVGVPPWQRQSDAAGPGKDGTVPDRHYQHCLCQQPPPASGTTALLATWTRLSALVSNTCPAPLLHRGHGPHGWQTNHRALPRPREGCSQIAGPAPGRTRTDCPSCPRTWPCSRQALGVRGAYRSAGLALGSLTAGWWGGSLLSAHGQALASRTGRWQWARSGGVWPLLGAQTQGPRWGAAATAGLGPVRGHSGTSASSQGSRNCLCSPHRHVNTCGKAHWSHEAGGQCSRIDGEPGCTRLAETMPSTKKPGPQGRPPDRRDPTPGLDEDPHWSGMSDVGTRALPTALLLAPCPVLGPLPNFL